jgi:radical SAM protein with 4Fe4S-binding SPASM domain
MNKPASDRFYLCYFETTRTCNLSCRYCMARLPAPAGKPELSTAEAKALVLDEIAKVTSNAAIAFSGGEHLLRPDAYELLAYAREKGFWSFVNTNARLLVEGDTVNRAMKATDGKIIFALPLNSVDTDVNKSTRVDDISVVMQAVEVCKKEGAGYFFIITVSKENLASMNKTMEFMKEKGIPVLRSPFVPRGSGREFAHLACSSSDMEAIVHPSLTSNPLSYISFTPFFASPEFIADTWKMFNIKIGGVGCQAGRSFAAVGAEGDVTPCVQMLDSGCVRGNVRETPLSRIILEDPVFLDLRSREKLGGKCGRCRYKPTCGGCRALAYYQNGDIMAEDPSCFFEPVDATTRSDLESAQTAGLKKFMLWLRFTNPWKKLF